MNSENIIGTQLTAITDSFLDKSQQTFNHSIPNNENTLKRDLNYYITELTNLFQSNFTETSIEDAIIIFNKLEPELISEGSFRDSDIDKLKYALASKNFQNWKLVLQQYEFIA